jgi:hypothetical protein
MPSLRCRVYDAGRPIHRVFCVGWDRIHPTALQPLFGRVPHPSRTFAYFAMGGAARLIIPCAAHNPSALPLLPEGANETSPGWNPGKRAPKDPAVPSGRLDSYRDEINPTAGWPTPTPVCRIYARGSAQSFHNAAQDRRDAPQAPVTPLLPRIWS